LAWVVLAWALSAGAFALAEDSIAQAQWHTLTGSEKSFTVELPGEAQYTASELRTGAGAPYTMHQYVLEQGDLAFVVQTALYPDEVDLANPRANLQGGLDNTAKNMEGGRWASVDWATQQGHPAVGAVGVCKGRAVRSFSVLAGRRIVALTYAGPPGTANAPDVDRFIGSLKIDLHP
jgi:hypothetical protein